MLEKLNDLPRGIQGLKAVGNVSKKDYEDVVEPLLAHARREGLRLRFLYQFGSEFERFSAGALWEDAKMGLLSMRLFEACAVVSDLGWIRESARLVGFLMPCPVKVFADKDRGKAVEWLRSVPQGAAISYRLHPETGVLVVEITEAMRVQDFDALALVADAWIEAHGHLQGLVVHAREFPGWRNLGSFFRHVRFVHNHHHNVKCIAVAADGLLARLAPWIGERFVQAKVKSFPSDQLTAAIAWACGPAGIRLASPPEDAPSEERLA